MVRWKNSVISTQQKKMPTKVCQVYECLACVDTMRVINTKMLADKQRKLLDIKLFTDSHLFWGNTQLLKMPRVWKKVIQSTLVISPSVSQHSRYVDEYEVRNSVPIHCIYIFAYKFRLSQHVFRSQTMFSRLDLMVCLDNHCIHIASCENCGPCVFPGQIWHQLIFPGAVSIGHWICKAYATRVCRIFNTYVCNLLQLFTDIHLFQEKKHTEAHGKGFYDV